MRPPVSEMEPAILGVSILMRGLAARACSRVPMACVAAAPGAAAPAGGPGVAGARVEPEAPRPRGRPARHRRCEVVNYLRDDTRPIDGVDAG